MAQERKRLDQLLVERGIALSRHKAQALIMAGEIFVDDQLAGKPGKTYPGDVDLDYRPRVSRFVSRGGEKLFSAFQQLRTPLQPETVLDIGSSTGGFTDLLLQRGAQKVYAVDVGKGLLDYKLRNDSRVVVLEGINARYLGQEHVPEEVDLAVIDVSFISLSHIIPAAAPLIREGGFLLPMIKPQFEAGKDQVPAGGVVRDTSVIIAVLRRIAGILYNEGMQVLELAPSRVKGPKGNQEFFMLSRKGKMEMGSADADGLIMKAVDGI